MSDPVKDILMLDAMRERAASVRRLEDYCGRCGELKEDHAPRPRYYCPRCGQVRCAIRRGGEFIVMPHYRYVDGSMSNRKACLGGPVDPKEDRAP